MAANDLSNKELIVKNYMKEMMKKEFPNQDTSDRGAFMETFGTTHLKLLVPLLEFADRVKLTQSLDNADMMTEAEMDELARGYFHYRKTGSYSVGYATLSFDDIPANGTIQIPGGAQAESKQGYRFRVVDTIVLDEEELANYYDTDTFSYRIPVLFEAENPGMQYDINEGELAKMVTALPNLSDLANEIAFRGGKDKETNLELADRIRTTAGTPNLGVERGWQLFAKEFDGVQDVIVAGFGHPLMERDIVGISPPGRFSSQASPDVHWGGKTDLHIRGKQLSEATDTNVLTTNTNGDLVMNLTKHPTHDILEITFTSPRYTDPDLDPSFFVVKDFLLMKDENRETVGTLLENSWVVIKDDRLAAQDSVTVRYRYNELIQTMNDALYIEDNRPPGSDVLLKESREKFIHSSMIIRLDTVVGIQEKDRSVIRQRLYNWISELPTGTEFQSSDLTAPIYQFDDSVDTKVDYISLPAQFIVTDYNNKFIYYCLNQQKRDFLEEVKQNSVYFEQWLPYFKDNVSLYDFFDFMHVLTYQNVIKDGWKTIQMKDHDWGKKVFFINIAKRMLAYVNAVQRLALPKWQSQQNDYFELGHLAVFEDVTYSPADLETFVRLIENIANPGEAEADFDTERILHLTVYCSVMLYVITAENIGGQTIKDLFDWLIDLTKGTPIDYQVHH